MKSPKSKVQGQESETLRNRVFPLPHHASRFTFYVSRFTFAALLLFGSLGAHAQSFSLDWSTVAGGGNSSSGGSFTLSGTTGQPDAGTLSGGGFTVEGGFWPGIVVPSTTGAPTLFVRVSGGTVTISWSSTATGFVLEETANLSTPSWSGAPQGNPVTIPVGGTSTFFRLRGP